MWELKNGLEPFSKKNKPKIHCFAKSKKGEQENTEKVNKSYLCKVKRIMKKEEKKK